MLRPGVIRRRRYELGLSTVQLGERAEISPSHITNIELGRRTPSPEYLVRLAKALEVEPSDLLEETA